MDALFTNAKAIVGMIHVGALPGAPRQQAPLGAVVERAVAETRLFARFGLDGLILENMHDVPYLRGAVGPEITAAMTAVGVAVRAEFRGAVGVQVLAAANREALAVALACGAQFIRVENFAYAHVADEGLMSEAAAGPLLRYRRRIGAEHVRVIADVKKKHAAHALTADVPLAEAAAAAEFCGADGIVVTGAATGRPVDVQELRAAREATSLPVWIGSGVVEAALPALWPHADAWVVGSALKQDGTWSNEVDPRRVERLMRAVESLRMGAPSP